MFRYEHKLGDIPTNKERAWAQVLQCESALPRKCMTTAIHALTHAWDDIAYVGPWFESWCLPMESWMKFMRKNIFSMAYPGQNLVNRVGRSMRLSSISHEVRREIRDAAAAIGYQPSVALHATLGLKPSDQWLGVRHFSKIASGHTRVQPPFQLIDMCNDHAQHGQIWLRSRSEFQIAVTSAKTQSLAHPAGEKRKSWLSKRLSDHIDISFARSLSYRGRHYSSAFVDGYRENTASWIWIKGPDVQPRWDQIWYGRIMYFVHAAVKESQSNQFLAAIKVFESNAIGKTQSGQTTIRINPDSQDYGLFSKLYFVRVESLGGRVCLGKRPDANTTHRWITRIDHVADD